MSSSVISYRLDRLSVYETSKYLYLIGHVSVSPPESKNYRLISFDKGRDELKDIICYDEFVWSRSEIDKFLETINLTNRDTGGIKHIMDAVGIVGFPRFLDCYYISLITQSKKVGCINNKTIYQVKQVEIIPIQGNGKNRGYNAVAHLWSTINNTFNKSALEIAEARYVGLYNFLDMSKDFYFSYDYDLTKCLQLNFTSSLAKHKKTKNKVKIHPTDNNDDGNNKSRMNSQTEVPKAMFKEDFLWNYYQMKEFKDVVGDTDTYLWYIPLIHGSFHQQRFDIFGKPLDLILIARRSTHYAGTRFLKRGVSVHGKVANDVEVEQILQLDGPYDGVHASFVSFTQMRGSIPTYWSQEVSVTNPKPPVIRGTMDSERGASRAHFRDLICRYGTPIIVLDLVKQFERKPREVIIGQALKAAVAAVNKSIDPKHQIRYIGLDYSRSLKKKDKDHDDDDAISMSTSSTDTNGNKNKDSSSIQPSVPTSSLKSVGVGATNINNSGPSKFLHSWAALEEVSLYSFAETDFFVRRDGRTSKLQSGVLRTNCVDCLDRTGVAQYIAGVAFLPIALKELGLQSIITAQESMGVFRNTLRDMYAEMSDRISFQYGGSEAHKKIYGARSALLTNIKRYYSNAFTDQVKQDAMNIFLGKFQPLKSNVPLWEMDGDFMLHNSTHVPLCSLTDLSLHSNCFNRDWLLKILGKTGIKCKSITECQSATTITNSQGDQKIKQDSKNEDEDSAIVNEEGKKCDVCIDGEKFVAIIEDTRRKKGSGRSGMIHDYYYSPASIRSSQSQSQPKTGAYKRKSLEPNRDLLFQSGFMKTSTSTSSITDIGHSNDDSNNEKEKEKEKEKDKGMKKEDDDDVHNTKENDLHQHKTRELTTLYKAAEAQWWMTALAQFRIEAGLRDINQCQSSTSTSISVSTIDKQEQSASTLAHKDQVIDSVCLTHSTFHDAYKASRSESGGYRRKTPQIDDCTLDAMHYVDFELPGYDNITSNKQHERSRNGSYAGRDSESFSQEFNSTESPSFSLESRNSHMSIVRAQSDVYSTLSMLAGQKHSKLSLPLHDIDINDNIDSKTYDLNSFQISYHPYELSSFKEDIMLPTSIPIGGFDTSINANVDSSGFYISNTNKKGNNISSNTNKKGNNISSKSFVSISSSASSNNTSLRKIIQQTQMNDEQNNTSTSSLTGSSRLPIAIPISQSTSPSSSQITTSYDRRPSFPPSTTSTTVNSATNMTSGTVSPLSPHDAVHSYGVVSSYMYPTSPDNDNNSIYSTTIASYSRPPTTFSTISSDKIVDNGMPYSTLDNTNVAGSMIRGNRNRTLSSPMSIDSRISESDLTNLLNADEYNRNSISYNPIPKTVGTAGVNDGDNGTCSRLLSDSAIPTETLGSNQHEHIDESTTLLYKDYADLDSFANSKSHLNHISSLMKTESDSSESDPSSPYSSSSSSSSSFDSSIRSLPIPSPRMVGHHMTDEDMRKYVGFQKSLAPLSIKSNDVHDLQKLAEDCGYSDHVKSGVYAGKPWYSSAATTTAAIFGITDSLEPELDLARISNNNMNTHENTSLPSSSSNKSHSLTRSSSVKNNIKKSSASLSSATTSTSTKRSSKSTDSSNSIMHKLRVEEKALNSNSIERDRLESRVLSNDNLNGLARAAVQAGATADKDGDMLHKLEKIAVRPPTLREYVKRSARNSRDLRIQMQIHTSKSDLRSDRVRLMCYGAVLAASLDGKDIGDVTSLELNARREIRRHLYRQLMYHHSVDTRLQQRISNLTNEKTLFQYYSNQSDNNSLVEDIESIHFIMTQEILNESLDEKEKHSKDKLEKKGSGNFSKFKAMLHEVAVARLKQIMWLRRPGADTDIDTNTNTNGSDKENISVGNEHTNKKEKIETKSISVKDEVKEGITQVKKIHEYEELNNTTSPSQKNVSGWSSNDDDSDSDDGDDSDGDNDEKSKKDEDNDEDKKITKKINNIDNIDNVVNDLIVKIDDNKMVNNKRRTSKSSKSSTVSTLATANLWELGQPPADYPPDLGLFMPYNIVTSSENPMTIEEEFLHRSATSELFFFKSNSMLIMNRIAAVMFCSYRGEVSKNNNSNINMNNNSTSKRKSIGEK